MADIKYVSDIETVKEIFSKSSTKENLFIKFFLSRKTEKLYINKEDFIKLEEEIEKIDNLTEDVKIGMISKIYGLATPYEDNNDDDDKRNGTIKIVERNYATVYRLITINPEKYKNEVNKFSSIAIITISRLMIEVQGSSNTFLKDLYKEFEEWWEAYNKN